MYHFKFNEYLILWVWGMGMGIKYTVIRYIS